MHLYQIPFWKIVPFSRLLLPLSAGILLQWYNPIPFNPIAISIAVATAVFILFYFLPLNLRYRYRYFQGIFLMLIVLFVAMFLTRQKNVSLKVHWFGHRYTDSSKLLVRIIEPVLERDKSFKTEALVTGMISGKIQIPVTGKIFLYFSKEDEVKLLAYGDQLVLRTRLQPIRNSGNPGSFNYSRYAAFQQVYHTAFLKKGDWIRLPQQKTNPLQTFIFYLRKQVIGVLQKNIVADKNITGIAEALLIGYKEDLDKDLVQAYSNAGVVHIIAISGLHLGLIYMMLVWICARIPFVKKNRISKVLIVLGSLWLFSLLTGASASVLRSAVMFTCIIIGKEFFRQASIYNSLAASACMLLCYNPYLLWDVGFQLSYLAIIGIVALQKPILGLFTFKNKFLFKTWEMLAVTVAAQAATFPVCLYYFHQFPNLFFITNLIAVPLSTVILFAEILLICVAWIPWVSIMTGKLIAGMVWVMNALIGFCNGLPFSVTDHIYADILSTWLLYILLFFGVGWLMYSNRPCRWITLICLVFFTGYYQYIRIKASRQKKMIVYQVPRHQAIDFIHGKQFQFMGDSALVPDGLLKHFHLKPARIALQASKQTIKMPELYQRNQGLQFFGKKILIIDKPVSVNMNQRMLLIDVLVLSKNARVKLADLARVIRPKMIVMDASNSLWKIAVWKKDCDELALPCFSVPEQGAFMLDLNH